MSEINNQFVFDLVCQNCKNKDFIIHKPGELQCSKCGKYVDSKTLKKAQFAKKYARKTQQSILDKMIAETKAKLIITIQLQSCHILGGVEIDFPTWTKDGGTIKIYKANNSFITSYYFNVDIYAHYDTSKWRLDSPGPESELLIISDKLPEFYLAGSDGGSYRVPVSQEPDKLVFTGATVGGITTGGFHTQPGKIQYETRTVGAFKYWKVKGTFIIPSPKENHTLSLESFSGFRILSHSNSYPERYARYFKDFPDSYTDYFKVAARCIWNVTGEEDLQKYSSHICSPLSSIPMAEIFHVLLYQDALPDNKYYEQACILISNEKRTLTDLKKAAEMFDMLGDYKDSVLKYQTCLHEIETRNYKTGCYVATAIYGSYDCPQVWTLRRYRDYTLAESWFGRLFIYLYYAISPTLVKWFGETQWFRNMWKPRLDKMVKRLNDEGVANTPYQDRQW